MDIHYIFTLLNRLNIFMWFSIMSDDSRKNEKTRFVIRNRN